MKDSCPREISRRCFLESTVKSCVSIGLPSVLLGYGRAEAAGNTDSAFEPAYLELHRTGELGERAEKLWTIMENCRLCPRRCGVDRHQGERGICRAPGIKLFISSSHPHFGEERPLVGEGGSGTIFLTHCNLRCVFCQNFEIANLGIGAEKDIDDFAGMMLINDSVKKRSFRKKGSESPR